MTSNRIIEKSEVREYFNGTGFERWNKIYSNSDEINTVQKNIRKGHQKTVDDVVSYIKNYPELTKKSYCEEINFKLRDCSQFKVKQKTKLQIITSEVFYIRCNKNCHGKFQLDPGAS